jgi:hypothetical protein
LTNEQLPDGFVRLAEQLERRAAGEADPALREKLLAQADSFRRLDQKARAIWSDTTEVQKALGPPATKAFRADAWLYCGMIGFTWLLSFLRGVETAMVAVASALSLLIVAVWYLQTRDVGHKPTRTEKAVAWLWTVLRALVGVVGGVVFLVLPAVVLVLRGRDVPDPGTLASLLISGLLGIACLWVGFVGSTGNPVSDLQRSRERRGRYGSPI